MKEYEKTSVMGPKLLLICGWIKTVKPLQPSVGVYLVLPLTLKIKRVIGYQKRFKCNNFLKHYLHKK